MEIIKIYQNRCAVRGCATKKNVGISLHKFPKKGHSWLEWVRACKNEDLSTLDLSTITSKRLFVCHRHFTDGSFYSKRNGQLIPKHGIIPTLNLPNDEEVAVNAVNIELPELSSEGFEVRVKNINMAQSAMYSPSVGRLSTAECGKPEEKLLNCRKRPLHFRETPQHSSCHYVRPFDFQRRVKMNLKFACNLSFMFLECPTIIGRYQLAKEAGFKAVESGFPFGYSIQQVAEAKTKADIEQVLINVFTGDVTKGELGFAAIPGKEDNFERSIDLTIEYAKALNCKKIHVMSGKVDMLTKGNDEVYERNLRYAVRKFEAAEIVGLIEPINPYTVPNYYMNSLEKGLAIVKKINSPNLRLMLDIFHVQQISGSLTHTIREYLPYVGHVQVAQVPDRNEPDTPGEIDYRYIFSLLEKEGYDDYVGLEYKPKTNTIEGIKWIKRFGFNF